MNLNEVDMEDFTLAATAYDQTVASSEKLSDKIAKGYIEEIHRGILRQIQTGCFNFDCGRAYAQTTRFELAEAMECTKKYNKTLIVGIEEGFSGSRYIKYTLNKKCPNAYILSSLEDCCKQVIRSINCNRFEGE